MRFIALFLSLSLVLPDLLAQERKDSLFTTSEIVLKTPTGEISGTLTIPDLAKIFPLVLIIPGSGPTDRDGNSSFGLNTNAYKMLSSGFAVKGIASLRFDKRGIGKSKAAIKAESDLRFETYIDDIIAWISLLKSDKRFSQIFLLGHSEGSLIGMIAAEKAVVSGFISLAGPGKSADLILQEQLKPKLPSQLMDESNRILDSLRVGKTIAKVTPFLMTLYRPSVQPYLISWIKYDPGKEMAKLTIPLLIIQGTTDIQVTVNDAKLLANSNIRAKLVLMDHMNHVLKDADADLQKNMATYNNPDLPLKTLLVEEMVNFVATCGN
jgi:uncharacterized protein